MSFRATVVSKCREYPDQIDVRLTSATAFCRLRKGPQRVLRRLSHCTRGFTNTTERTSRGNWRISALRGEADIALGLLLIRKLADLSGCPLCANSDRTQRSIIATQSPRQRGRAASAAS